MVRDRSRHNPRKLGSFLPTMTTAQWTWVSVLTIVVVLAARLALTAWQLETAPGVLSVMTQESTLGWVGWEHEQINNAPGSRQADFWLAEADRVLTEHPTSEMARGAAWMLDSPGTGFYARYLKPTNFTPVPVTVDSERVSEEKSAFEAKAGRRCVEIAELATRLAPDEAQGWRTRAMLLFQNPTNKADSQPRNQDWRVTLGKAAERDPNNALYDYLTADQLWNESTSHDYSNNNVQLIVKDAQRFAECSVYFEQGQKKDFPRASAGDWQAIVRFLARSNVPRQEHPELINSRLVQARETGLEYRLLRMQIKRAEREPPDDKLRLLRTCLRLAEQVGATEDLTGIDTAKRISDIAAANLSDLLQKHRPELSASRSLDIKNQLKTVHIRNLVWETAGRDLLSSTPPASQSFSAMFWGMLLSWLLQSTVLLAVIALFAWLGSRVLFGAVGSHQRTLDIVRHGFCWILAFGASFVLLGLAPAQVVSISVQQASARVLIAFVPVAVIVASLVFMLRRRKWRFSLSELLVATPILGAVLLMCLIGLANVTESGTGYYVPARLDDGVDPAAIQAAVPMFQSRSIEWALVQWNAFSGMTVAILLALALIACWTWYRSGRREDASGSRYWGSRVRGTFGAVSRSAACAVLLALIAFLALAPTFLRDCQSNYESQMVWYFDLQDRRESMAAKVEAIESDAASMKQLRELAEQKVVQPRQ